MFVFGGVLENYELSGSLYCIEPETHSSGGLKIELIQGKGAPPAARCGHTMDYMQPRTRCLTQTRLSLSSEAGTRAM